MRLSGVLISKSFTKNLNPMIRAVGHQNSILAIYVYKVRFIKLTFIGAQFTESSQEFTRRMENTYSYIRCLYKIEIY